MDALTGNAWSTVLARIKDHSPNDSMRTLASMLYDIVQESTDPKIDAILDAYGARLLGPL